MLFDEIADGSAAGMQTRLDAVQPFDDDLVARGEPGFHPPVGYGGDQDCGVGGERERLPGRLYEAADRHHGRHAGLVDDLLAHALRDQRDLRLVREDRQRSLAGLCVAGLVEENAPGPTRNLYVPFAGMANDQLNRLVLDSRADL